MPTIDIQRALQNLMYQLMGHGTDPGAFLGQGAPLLQTGDLQTELMDLFNATGDIFIPGGFDPIKQEFLTSGTRAINTQRSAANRAAGAATAKSGMGDTFVASQAPMAIQDSANEAIAGLYGQIPAMEMDYNQNLFQTMLARSGLLGQIAGLRQGDYGSQLNQFNLQAQGFPNLFNTLIGYGAYRGY